MAPLGENYRKNHEHVVCPLCSNHLDNQPTFLHCEAISISNKIPTKMEIEDIYCENITLETARNITIIEEIRKSKLKELEGK